MISDKSFKLNDAITLELPVGERKWTPNFENGGEITPKRLK